MNAPTGQLALLPQDRSRVRVVAAQPEEIYLQELLVTIAGDPAYEVAGSAADGPSALALIRQALPDVAVLEAWLPELDGMQILHAIQRDELPTRVVMLTGGPEERRPYAAIGAGACAYLTRPVGEAEIREALAVAATDDILIDERLHTKVIEEMSELSSGDQLTLDPVTKRILEQFADDTATPAAVAERMEISETTVKSHLRAVYRILGVETLHGAVARVLRDDLIR
jgi:two-component system nitrate/nitrite response regulator NarL